MTITTTNLLMLLIPLVTTIVLSSWGAVKSWVTKRTSTLPKWAQPLPPLVLSVVASATYFLTSGVSPDVTNTTLAGFATVGLYHVGRRWIPAVILDALRTAVVVRKLSASALVILMAVCCASMQTPAKMPSVQRLTPVVHALISKANDALGKVITILPEGTDLAPWEARVEALEDADAAVDKAGATVDDVCAQLPTVRTVAVFAECVQCVDILDVVTPLVCDGGAK